MRALIGSWLLGLLCLSFSAGLWADEQSASSEYLSIDAITLSHDRLSLTVDPNIGSRIRSFTFAGRELLFDAASQLDNQNNWGSTFWLSPQRLWGWPPIAAHDSQPYSVELFDETRLALNSAAAHGARVRKHFELNPDTADVATLTYTIVAEQPFAEIAAWEITRVARQGLVFYPARQSSLEIVMGSVDYEFRDDVVWIALDASNQPPQGKLNANGTEGWLAWVHGRVLFMKIYEPVKPAHVASGEGDIEIYLSGDDDYIELELQSAAHALSAGDKLEWQVRWWVTHLPGDLSLEVGNRHLLTWVRQQAKLWQD